MAPWGDDVGLGSGLWDRAEVTIRKVRVGHPYEKNPTQAAVVFDVERKDEDGEIEEDHFWLKPGTQFEPGDKDGTFLVHEQQTPEVFDTPSAKKKKINKNSAYGKFLNSMNEAAGGSWAPLVSNQDPAREKYEIWDVLFWEGLVLDVENVAEKYEFEVDEIDPTTGQKRIVKGESRQPYVRAIMGKADASAAATASETTAAAPAGGSNNGTPESYETYMKYVEAHVAGGGAVADAISQDEWTAAKAKATASA